MSLNHILMIYVNRMLLPLPMSKTQLWSQATTDFQLNRVTGNPVHAPGSTPAVFHSSKIHNRHLKKYLHVLDFFLIAI